MIIRNKLNEELLVKYVNNLANSCLNMKTLNSNKKNFIAYKQKINKKKILKQYRSKNIKIADILKPYIPNHPDFFKFIDYLKKNKMTKKEKRKLVLNIERLKLMKYYSNNYFIQVNIPAYNFSIYENNKKAMSFGTVVGDFNHQTPIISSKLDYYVVNPTWNIPDSITKKSIIPKMLKDKKYLSKKNIVIRSNYHLNSKKFNQYSTNWKKYLKKNVKYIPYKFIQLPSKTNAMGRIKFMFANDFAVYLHDTIGTWRFKNPRQSIRAASHGCVRLEHPLALIKHITTFYTPYTYRSARKKYDSFDTHTISLSKKLPIHTTYITSYISNAKLFFYKDVYKYDLTQKLNYKIN